MNLDKRNLLVCRSVSCFLCLPQTHTNDYWEIRIYFQSKALIDLSFDFVLDICCLEYRFAREKLSWTASNRLMKKNQDQKQSPISVWGSFSLQSPAVFIPATPLQLSFSQINMYRPVIALLHLGPSFSLNAQKPKRPISQRMRRREQLPMRAHTILLSQTHSPTHSFIVFLVLIILCPAFRVQCSSRVIWTGIHTKALVIEAFKRMYINSSGQVFILSL